MELTTLCLGNPSEMEPAVKIHNPLDTPSRSLPLLLTRWMLVAGLS